MPLGEVGVVGVTWVVTSLYLFDLFNFFEFRFYALNYSFFEQFFTIQIYNFVFFRNVYFFYFLIQMKLCSVFFPYKAP